MPVSKKRRAHSRAVREKTLAASRAKAALLSIPIECPPQPDELSCEDDEISIDTYEFSADYPDDIHHDAHWEGLSDSEEESDIDMSEPEDNVPDEGKDAFETVMQARKRVENNKWGHKVLSGAGT
jgi:hypothetical protein